MPQVSVKQHLVEREEDVFRRRGFNGCSVQGITSAAGVPKGSFYSHSARKQELAAEIVGRYNHATDVGILKAGSESAVRRLRSHFHAQAAQTEQSGMEFGCPLGTLGAESPAAGENVRAKVAASLDIRTDAVAAAVEEAQSTRKVAPNRPARELAAYLIDSFEGATLRAKSQETAPPS